MNLLTRENICYSIAFFIPTFYLWKRLYKTYMRLKKEYEDTKLFYDRHNCVVMYSGKYIKGWPPSYTIKIEVNNFDLFLEPFLYFIKTAKFSLDIAAMKFSIPQLLDAVQMAVERGVKVRLLAQFYSSKKMIQQYLNLNRSGVQIVFYIDRSNQMNYIMHSKCIIKDYDGSNGFICIGSLNLTGITSVINNFEDVVFTSQIVLVEEFHKYFENSWNIVKKDNEKPYNRSVLMESGFL